MMLGLLIISKVVATVIAAVAAVAGHGVLLTVLIYWLSASLTLMLLASLVSMRTPSGA